MFEQLRLVRTTIYFTVGETPASLCDVKEDEISFPYFASI